MNRPAPSASVSKRRLSWALWTVLTLGTALGLASKLSRPDRSKELFLPGTTTHGHYQIELSCEACHTEEFTETADFQTACVGCHGAEMEAVEDSHPESKFTDPRNAERVATLDARHCVTCHSEHQPERTGTMGLSLPGDYCYHCHQEIAEERPSHAGLAFDSCASAGCHNFHDNKALYEDYLLKHGREPPLLAEPFRLLATSKACPSQERATLSESTPVTACQDCHSTETKSWLSSRHGMRVGQGLPPMTPKEARLPMKESAGHRLLGCASCHDPRRATDATFSGLTACEGCHNDEHSRAYRNSKHYEFLVLEQEGRIARGSGATCATCHMPRAKNDDGDAWVNHNPNDNLRPNEKMIRSACGTCHGLPFTIDALADRALIRSNFSGQPESHVKSVDFALARE